MKKINKSTYFFFLLCFLNLTLPYILPYIENKKVLNMEINEDYSALKDNYNPNTRYGYMQLSEEDKKYYKKLLNAILLMKSEVAISNTLGKDRIETIKNTLLMDYTNLFWFDNVKYTWTETPYGDIVSNITVVFSYTMTEEDRDKYQMKLDNEVNNLLVNLPKDSSDYETVKYVYEKLIDSIEYNKEDIDNEYNQNLLSALLDKKTVCAGYAKATSYILNKLGIQSLYVYGDIVDRGAHAWNIIKVQDDYYYVDTTWGDGSFENIGDTFINYKYLLVDEKSISKTHIFSEEMPVNLPKCDTLKDNYFIREGLYFKSFDKDGKKKLKKLIKESTNGYIEIKCKDKKVLNQYGDYVLNNLYNSISYLDDTILLIDFR